MTILHNFPRKLLVSIIFILLSNGCGGRSQSPATRLPPSAAAPSAVESVMPEVRNIISIRLEEIRLTEKAQDRHINISNVWMIPINVKTNTDEGVRFQYVEREGTTIDKDNPYIPTGKWFISINRDDLNDKDFGLWFMVTGNNDAGKFVKKQFETLMQEAAPHLATGFLLTILTPGVPDEIIAAVSTAAGGQALMGRVAALGSGAEVFIKSMVKQTVNLSDLNSADVEKFAGNLARAAQALDGVGYFGEVYVTFSAQDGYRLNNRVSVVTTDGSLMLVFSIFETSNVNDPQFTSSNETESFLPLDECNPQVPSSLLSGIQAKVIATNLALSSSAVIKEAPILGQLKRNDIIVPTVPYCDLEENILWWKVQTENGIFGWLPESRGTTIFLERITE